MRRPESGARPEAGVLLALRRLAASCRHSGAARPIAVRSIAAKLLQRALENVLRNAVKYSPSGNEITLTTQLDETAQRLKVSILDQGPGVPVSELKLIFEPFYRGSNTNTAGHGLGLAIAIRIVEAHGGNIGAANREQGGLQVDITLPVSATKVQ